MPNEKLSGYDLERLRAALCGWNLHYDQTLTSTNDQARLLVETESFGVPAIVLADMQTAGRGRGRKTWWSSRKNLAATFIMPRGTRPAFGLVPLLAGMSVRRALVSRSNCDTIALKWPNDLMIGRQKLAGLLCARLEKADLIGIGVNVNAGRTEAPLELRDRITSLQDQTGRRCDQTEILIAIAQELQSALTCNSAEDLHQRIQEYAQHHWPTGCEITLVDTDNDERITGRCQGIDAEGKLLIRVGDTIRAFYTGTVVSVGPRVADLI